MRSLKTFLTFSLILAAGGMSPSFSRASEIDDISTFYTPSADSAKVLDRRVYKAFEKAIGNYRGDCNLKTFAASVAQDLVSFRYYSGAFETFAKTSDEIERLSPELSKSIYRNSAFSTSIIGRSYGIDPTLIVSGVRIGSDKLGHFMDHGYKLYELHQSGMSVRDVLKYATAEEEGAFGLLTTGIKSFGDIASAYDGFRFWKNISGDGAAPYFKCESGRIRQIREFKFDDYVTRAWSEAINCNAYYNWSFTDEVRRNTEEVEKRDGRRYACPILPESCASIHQHYSKWLPVADVDLLISPLCPRTAQRTGR